MKNIIGILLVTLFLAAGAFAQDMEDHAKPTDADKTAAIPSGSYLKRGMALTNAKKVSIEKALKDPGKFADKTVRLEGVVVRSCKMEGCWAQVADKADGKSVRVTMKDHSFFIPLQSAGAMARVEGKFIVKTLPKEHVDHLIAEDGAKFDNRNADGSVTEVSFEATGIELTAAKKS